MWVMVLCTAPIVCGCQQSNTRVTGFLGVYRGHPQGIYSSLQKWRPRGSAVALTWCCSETPFPNKVFKSVRRLHCRVRAFAVPQLCSWNVTDGWGARLAHAYSRKCDVVNRGVSPSAVRTRHTHACVCVVA